MQGSHMEGLDRALAAMRVDWDVVIDDKIIHRSLVSVFLEENHDIMCQDYIAKTPEFLPRGD